MPIQVRAEFDLQYLWVGVFWNAWESSYGMPHLDITVCLIPAFPIHIHWYGGV